MNGFSKRFVGAGHYIITYQKSNQKKSYYQYLLTDMPLFDAVFNCEEEPKKKDVCRLKYLVLRYGSKIEI